MYLRCLRYFLLKRIFLVIIAFVIIFIIIFLQKGYVKISGLDSGVLQRETMLLQIDEAIKNAANAKTCNQPDLPVYAPEIMKFVKYVPPIDCSHGKPDWVICKNSECRISEAIIVQKGPIKCSFVDVIRVNDYEYIDGEKTYSDSYYKLEKSDTVKVHCNSAEEKWNSVLTSIRFDKGIWDRTGWEYTPDDGLKLNVLIFAIDSLSRNTVIRKLPEMFKYVNETLEALILEGYNIVGDGTPQALTPILTGKTELELPDTRKRVENTQYVDVYPFIWNDFRSNGYVTGYLEDSPETGTYTYRLNGFNKPPTDHYMRPYFMNAAKIFKKSPKYCAGNIPRHQVMLNYVKSYFRVYKSKPKFMLAFHSELSHDDYNLVGAADNDFMNFLKDIHDSGALNNTLLIVMADHGHRFADIRNTIQGKMEERLPFFSFTFPKWFKEKHSTAYANFKSNLKTLVTPYDIHATLMDVLHLSNVGEADLTKRSLSLFSQIPQKRSCAEAYIEPHWCACLNWNAVKLNDPIVEELGDAFVKTLNDYTNSHRDICAELKIAAVYWVSKLEAHKSLLQFKKNADYDGFVPDLSGKTDITTDIYQMKVMLSPGDSLFEVTITHYLKENRMDVKISDVSRINMYGDQARCIEKKAPPLRKYCYCTTD